MFFFLTVLACAVYFPGISLSDQKECSKCAQMQSDSHVFKFCHDLNSTSTMFIKQSCCVNKTSMLDVIIGLDWSECGLKTVQGSFSGLTSLQVLMLENNTELNLKSGDFDGLISLEYLSLPSKSECPGGNNSWESTEKTNNTVICHTELNLCEHHNMSCPNNNSHCVMTAPGAMECLCNDGYYGYKCLRQGHFSTGVYTIVLCVCTVVLSVFLWCTQRRKVIKVH